MTRPVRGYVLAGGASSRMGRDKARIPWRGLPMAAHVASVLAEAGVEVSLVRRGPADGEEGWTTRDGAPLRVVREAERGERHPLLGVLTALEDAVSDVLIVPCDVPRLRPLHVVRLVEAGAPAVAWDGERVHPLVAMVGLDQASQARAVLEAGGPARALMQGATRVSVPPSALHNVNRPGDLD